MLFISDEMRYLILFSHIYTENHFINKSQIRFF